MSETFNDYCWHGTPEAIAVAITDQPNVIGPRVLDGVSYVKVRSTEELTRPEGVKETGTQLSDALLGVWA